MITTTRAGLTNDEVCLITEHKDQRKTFATAPFYKILLPTLVPVWFLLVVTFVLTILVLSDPFSLSLTLSLSLLLSLPVFSFFWNAFSTSSLSYAPYSLLFFSFIFFHLSLDLAFSSCFSSSFSLSFFSYFFHLFILILFFYFICGWAVLDCCRFTESLVFSARSSCVWCYSFDCPGSDLIHK